MTSTVDWCEENYEYVDWIAELWNTLSSLILTIAGLTGFYKYYHLKGSSVYLILFLVGVGSVLFHAMLTVESQMLDEIPMIFLVVQLLANTVELTSAIKIIMYAITTIYSVFIYNTASIPQLQFMLFQFTIISSGCIIFFTLLRIAFKSNAAFTRFSKGSTFFLLGWTFWLVDFFLCSTLKETINPQFHAWWHIFSAIGIYHIAYISLLACNEVDDMKVEKL